MSEFLFLSTLSLRRATLIGPLIFNVQPHFYPRSPCGERLPSVLHSFRPPRISIHALLAESDWLLCCMIHLHLYFYPRSPCGERPYHFMLKIGTLHFYPRSPCGERRLLMCFWPFGRLFLSTLSLRRATVAPVLAVGRA